MSSRNITLAFHKLSPRLSYGATNYSPRRFETLLHLLGLWHLPLAVPGTDDNGVVISFDDGYGHLIEQLPPLIERWRFVPIIFVPTALIGKANSWDYSHFLRPEKHLDAAGIRMLSEMGVVFGAHGHSHTDLTSLSDGELRLELRRSKQTLEDITGKPVDSLSYPFGRCNARVAAVAEELGYARGYTMQFPRSEDAPLSCGRVAVYGYDTPLSLRCKLGSSGFAYQIERLKARVTNQLSSGTILLNRIRGLRRDRA